MTQELNQQIESLYLGDLVAISNVRQGELPNIDKLAGMLRVVGQQTPILVCRVDENIELLEKEIPRQMKVLEDLQKELGASEGDVKKSMGDALRRQQNLLETMKAELVSLHAVEDKSEKYRIMDGHRRCAALDLLQADEVKAIVVAPDASPIDTQIKQLSLGLSAENVTPWEEGLAYEKLRAMGMTAAEIDARMGGVSRDTIRQRINGATMARRAQKLNSAESQAFLEALEDGSLSSKNFNKLGQYHDTEMSLPDLAEALENAVNMEYKTFQDWCNDKFGKKAGVKDSAPRQPKAEGDGEQRTRLRSQRGVQEDLDMLTKMLSLAEANKDKFGISDEDLAVLRGQAAYASRLLGDGALVIPSTLSDIEAQVQEALEAEKQASLKEKAADGAVQSEAKKKANKAQAEERRNVRSEFKAKEKSILGVVERMIADGLHKVGKLKSRIEAFEQGIKAGIGVDGEPMTDEQRAKAESMLRKAYTDLNAAEAQVATFKTDLIEKRSAFEASKPDWLVEEEEEAKKRKAEKKEKGTEAASK